MTNAEYFDLVDISTQTTRENFVAGFRELLDPAFLGAIWDATHRTIKDVADAAGMSVRQLGLHFAIPRRTIEDWSRGIYPPPIYTLLLIQEALGLLDVRRK